MSKVAEYAKSCVSQMQKKPLLTACAFFVALSYIFAYSAPALKIAVAVLAVSSGIVQCVFAKFRTNKSHFATSLLISCAAVVASIVSLMTIDVRMPKIVSDISGMHEAEILVISENSKTSYSSSYVASVTCEGRTFRAVIYFDEPVSVESGGVVKINASFSLPSENDSGFPMRKYLLAKNILMQAEVVDFDVTDKTRPSPEIFFGKINLGISKHIKSLLGEDAGSTVCGILLGRRNDVADSIKRDFRRLGISHMLAISGMHLSIVCTAAEFLLRKIGTPRKARSIIGIVLILSFMGIAGFSYSVVRAGIMMAICELGALVSGKADSATSLFLAGTIILTLSPTSVYDIGFLLSFTATLGIIWAGKPMYQMIMKRKRLPKFAKYILSSFAVSLSALMFTIPPSAIYFGYVSLVSLPCNLVFSILVTAILYLSLAVATIGIIPILGGGICSMCSGLVRVTILLSSEISKLENITVSLDYPFFGFVVAGTIVLFLLSSAAKKHRAAYMTGSFAVGIAAFFVCLAVFRGMHEGEVGIYGYSIRSGDGIAVSVNDKNIIFDVSSGTYGAAKTGTDLTLSKLRSDETDLFVITDYASRTIATVKRLIECQTVRAYMLCEPADENETAAANEISDIARSAGADVFFFREGEEFEAEGLRVTISKAFIKRSVVPITKIEIKTDAGYDFMYLGRACDEAYTDSGEQHDVIFCGMRGPKVRDPENHDSSDKFYANYLAVYASGDIPKYADAPDVKVLSYDDGDYFFGVTFGKEK